MDDAQAVGAGQRIGQIEGKGEGTADGQGSLPGQHLLQVAPFDIFEDEVKAAVLLHRIPHFNNVGVVELAQGLPFAPKTSHQFAVAPD